MPNYDLYNISTSSSSNEWAIISFLVAICAGIVLHFTFLNSQNSENYTGATKKIADFLSFKTFSLDTILKIGYLIFAAYITLSAFSYIEESFVEFLIYLVIGNILVRLVFEGCLLIIMIYNKLNEINNKIRPMNKKEDKRNPKNDEKMSE